MRLSRRPLILIILDGWGYTENTVYNAIHSAKTPVWRKLWAEYPHTLVQASGIDVGLPVQQMGNSEVGHMNIGSGRVVGQEFSRINQAIENGTFYQNEILNAAFRQVKDNNKALHILGLLSDGGVHSHQKHIFKLAELAVQRGLEKIYLHAFLDGRDTPPKSAAENIYQMQLEIKALGTVQFASLIGRFFAMDRNRHWERTQQAYDLISQGKAHYRAEDPFIALDMAYARGETDEFVQATSITKSGQPPARVEDHDVIVFANYRADRARQLARAFTQGDFQNFPREHVPKLNTFISLAEYKRSYEFPVAFPPEHLENVFGQFISELGLRQLRIAETEKYAHVTFFFNGGEERVFAGEDRILVPSPHVLTYNLKPEMSAFEITAKLSEAIYSEKYDVIICNYANADMVGHTGDFRAATRAIEVLDTCLGRLIEAVTQVNGEMLITADHGNAEQMRTYTNEKVKSDYHTAHTNNPVPLVYLGRKAQFRYGNEGSLSDVAPTMLALMGIEAPKEMTGRPLLRLL